MRGSWAKPMKHADQFTSGVADLSAHLREIDRTVWIELKALDEWPKRARTKVVFELDELQRDFIWERRGWLFVRVRREYLLFNYIATNNLVDTTLATQENLRLVAKRIWKNSVNWKEFKQCLIERK
jgi:hypothetical protein